MGLMLGNKMERELKNVELLSISFDDTYTASTQILIALTNEQAVEYWANEYNVKCASKETRFLGNVLKESILYLQVRVPKRFGDRVKALGYVGEKIVFPEGTMVNLDITAQCWMNGPISGIILYYEGVEFLERPSYSIDSGLNNLMEKLDIYQVSPSALSPAEIYRLSQDQLDFYREGVKQSERDRVTQEQRRGYAAYVTQQRQACMPVMSRNAWIQKVERDRLKEREFANRRNRNKTYWKVGDVVGLNGKEYIVGKIDDIGDQWGIRLDQKFYESSFIRVPK